MNPVEKLVRRIRGSLKHLPDHATLQGLSREYARACEDVNRRLEQCTEMLRRENEYQALELAESHPAVLDLVTVLSFEEADDWKALCQKQKLAIPESLDEKAIRQLNELYSKGISANHPLYKQYRETMLGRDFPGALQVLRSITKLNPKDRNARQELERLENKVQAQKIESLREPLDCGIHDVLEDIIADIESSPWTRPPHGRLWDAAKLEQRRIVEGRILSDSGSLIRQMEAAQKEGDWRNVQDLSYNLQSRLQDSDVSLPADLTAKAETLSLWAQARENLASEEERFSQWLAAWPEEKAALAAKTPADLNRLYTELRAWIRATHPEGLAFSPELMARGEQARLDIRGEQKRRQVRILAIQSAVSLLVLVLVGAVAFLFWSHSRVRHAYDDVKTLLDQGRISAADDRLHELQQLQKWAPAAKNRTSDEYQELSNQIQQAHKLRDDFAQALAPFEERAAKGFAGAGLLETMKDYEALNQLRQQLPAEYKDEFAGRTGKLGDSWNQYLEQTRQASIIRLQSLIKQSSDLLKQNVGFDNDLAKVREGLRPLSKNISEIAGYISPAMSGLQLPPELIEQARTIVFQAKPYQDAMDALEQTGEKMRTASSLDEYLAAVKTISGTPFSSARETEAAKTLLRRNLSLDSFIATLLAPRFPNAPFPLRQITGTNLYPGGEPSEKERAIYLDLRDDLNLAEVYRCRINGNESNSRWKGDIWVFARGEPSNKESRISGEILKSEWKGNVYDPAIRPESAGFDAVIFNYNYTSKPPTGTRMVEQVLSAESDLFRRSGIRDVVDPESGTFKQPVLKVLDTLKADETLNPLFYGYVFSRIVALGSERPDAWGLSMTPSLQRDYQELQKIFTSEVFSSDWMVPRRVQASAPRLKKLFDSDRAVSYQKEAMLLADYYQRVSQAGFHFAGYVDESNTPQMNNEAKNALELWGWDSKDFAPNLIYQRTSASENWKTVHTPVLFSPLFSCPINREEAWNESVAAQNVPAGAPILTEFRPPFSRKSYER